MIKERTMGKESHSDSFFIVFILDAINKAYIPSSSTGTMNAPVFKMCLKFNSRW